MKTFEAGKLYQVYTGKDWVIAEYLNAQPAHSYNYSYLSFTTFKISPEKTRNVPDRHLWRKVRWGMVSNFYVDDRGVETRPVTDEALVEIEKLKSRLRQLEADRKTALHELKEFCG